MRMVSTFQPRSLQHNQTDHYQTADRRGLRDSPMRVRLAGCQMPVDRRQRRVPSLLGAGHPFPTSVANLWEAVRPV
jgi:hypothetical protein